ncbi:MAG: hypothetical protein AAFN65_00620 [Bacteroidota bacterium]
MAEKLPNDSSWSRRLADWEKGPEGPAPGPELWDRLDQSLSERRRRPLVLWWIVSIAFLVGIVGGTYMLVPAASSELPKSMGEVAGLERRPTVDAESSTHEPGPTVVVENTSNNPPSEPANPQLSDLQAIDDDTETRDEQAANTIERLSAHSTDQGTERSLTTPSAIIREEAPALLSERRDEEPVAATSAVRIGSTSLLQAPKMTGLQVNSLSAIDKSIDAGNSLDTYLQGELINPAFSQKRRLRFLIGFQAAFHQPEVRVQLPANTVTAQSITNSLASSWGLRFRLELNDRWGLTTGFNCGRESSEHRLSLLRIYRPETEVLDANGNARTTYVADFATDYSKADTEIEIIRPAGVELPANFWLRLGIRALERVKTTSIPLLVTYDQPIGNWLRLRIGTGIAWNRQTVSLEIQSRLSDPRGLNLVSSRIRSSEQFLDDQFWTGQLQTGLVIRPWKNIEIGVSPQFTASLSSLGEDRNLSTNFQRFSMIGEFYYRF